MYVISSNITTRDTEIKQLFNEWKAIGWNPQQEPARDLSVLAERCVSAGADALEINLQQHDDQPEAMVAAIKLIQQITDKQLCLSTNKPEVLQAGLDACKRPPIINYLSIDETRLREFLPVVARHNAELVLLVSEAAAPTDAREMLQKAAILIGAANASDIPNEHIIVDPGLIHVTSDTGQRHLVEVKQFLESLHDAFDPPVKSTCWIASASVGAPRDVRPVIERALLPMLAGVGLTSVFINVLEPENMRLLRLMKIFNNDIVYSESEITI